MPLRQARFSAPEPHEPVIHDLTPLQFEGRAVPVRLSVRQSEDRMWRARLLFGQNDPASERATAEIFCAETEKDLWHAVHHLHEHHIRDLYRSLL